MSTFDLALPDRVLFGPGRAEELPGLVSALGRNVLLCTGRDPSRHGNLLGEVDPVAVVTVAGEPTVDDVRAATEEARTAGAQVVVAIGGGSGIGPGEGGGGGAGGGAGAAGAP